MDRLLAILGPVLFLLLVQSAVAQCKSISGASKYKLGLDLVELIVDL